jgi:hypothetical protein
MAGVVVRLAAGFPAAQQWSGIHGHGPLTHLLGELSENVWRPRREYRNQQAE